MSGDSYRFAPRLLDFLFFPNFILAPSVSVSDNRLKESFNGALVSAFTFGLMNVTTNNVATHCLLIAGKPSLRVRTDNVILVGEIRDSETAKIAVQSALTGHLNST